MPHDCEQVDVEPQVSTQHGEHCAPQLSRQATPARSGGVVDIEVMSAMGCARSGGGGGGLLALMSPSDGKDTSVARSAKTMGGPVVKSGAGRGPASRSPAMEKVQPANAEKSTPATMKTRTNKPPL